MPPPIVLLHGAATTPAVWDRVQDDLAALGMQNVIAPPRPRSGSLETELAALAPLCAGALVVGQSGGATLALALAASHIRIAGAICHEPAVGALVPNLLTPFAAALDSDGVTGFGSALYGELWDRRMFDGSEAALRTDVGMFRRFNPATPRAQQGSVLVTVGADSPSIRYEAADALRTALGLPYQVVPDCGHFVSHENPAAFAAIVAQAANGTAPQ